MFDGLLDLSDGGGTMTILAIALTCAGGSLLFLLLSQIPWLLKLGQPRAGRIAWAIETSFLVLVFAVGVWRGAVWPVVIGTALATGFSHLLWEYMPPLQNRGVQAALGGTLFLAGALLWVAQ